MNSKVIVLGAGISGLTCAYRLHQAAVDTLLLESSKRTGGSINSFQKEGFLLELGPNSYTQKPEIESLTDDLGLRQALYETPLGDHPRYIFDGKQLREVPTGPLALISTPLLSGRAKLRLLREPFLRKPPGSNESIAEFSRYHFGPEILDLFVAPFVSGIYAGDPEQMSIQSAFPLLYEFAQNKGSLFRGAISHFRKKKKANRASGQPKQKRKRSALCSFRQGLSELTQKLEHQLKDRMQCNIQVDRIELKNSDSNHQSSVHLQGRNLMNNESLTWEAQGLVIAAPAWEAAKILITYPEAARALESIPYYPLIIVHVGIPLESVEFTPKGFGFLVPRNRGTRVLGILWTSSVFPGRAPEGHALMTLFYGGATDPEILNNDDDFFKNMAHEDLQKTMGWTGKHSLFQITRYEKALPGYPLDHPSISFTE